jgi:hypothetical protein
MGGPTGALGWAFNCAGALGPLLAGAKAGCENAGACGGPKKPGADGGAVIGGIDGCGW